jgi:3-dehydroquinate synthase
MQSCKVAQIEQSGQLSQLGRSDFTFEYPVQPAATTFVVVRREVDAVIGELNAYLQSKAAPITHLVLLIDSTVKQLYWQQLQNIHIDGQIDSIPIIALETNKTWQTVDDIVTALVELKANRNTVLLAVGGGVVSDIVGFVAAIYMRGITWMSIPTTLLAQVDAAVGGKTAINHANSKNLLGAFKQPMALFIAAEFCLTLGVREYRAGLAEVIKYGLILDADFITYLEAHVAKLGPSQRCLVTLEYIIRQSCHYKYQVVRLDEHDHGARGILNFGHTLGHALEVGTNFATYLHGEAVAIGICLETELSYKSGLLAADMVQRVVRLISSVGLPTNFQPLPSIAAATVSSEKPKDLDLQEFLSIIYRDKKILQRDGSVVTVVLLTDIGRAVVCRDIKKQLLENFLYEAQQNRFKK